MKYAPTLRRLPIALLAVLGLPAASPAAHAAAGPKAARLHSPPHAKPAAARMVLPFMDDYAKAVAQARARKVPLFIEAWAPW